MSTQIRAYVTGAILAGTVSLDNTGLRHGAILASTSLLLDSKSVKTIASHCYKRQVETAIPDKMSTQIRAYVTGAILASTSLLP
ncbi:hypothetical protein J6590_044007 [Homalodisca vitripennis]|nr:hypothetical protein J6590_044007 [Homalodisca vitripennis]